MNTSTRRERKREKVRNEILEAAKTLFASEGFDSVSMRRIGAKIEYSPAAIYRYFKNKQEIFSTLRDEGFKLMLAAQKERAATISDPLERLIVGGQAYVKFALNEPDYFQLMFNSMDKLAFEGDLGKSGLESFEVFRSNVAELVKQNHFADDNIDKIVLALWANVQGLAQLISSRRVEVLGDNLDLDQLIKDVIEFQLRPGSNTPQS